MQRFWMVLIDGTRSTSYKHPTLESARIEAERLLRYPDNYLKGATILEAVEYRSITYPPIQWDKISDGIYQGKEVNTGGRD